MNIRIATLVIAAIPMASFAGTTIIPNTYSNVSQDALQSLTDSTRLLKEKFEKIVINSTIIDENSSIIGSLNSRLKAVDGRSSVSGDISGYAGTTLKDKLNSTTSMAQSAKNAAYSASSAANNAQNTANNAQNTVNSAYNMAKGSFRSVTVKFACLTGFTGRRDEPEYSYRTQTYTSLAQVPSGGNANRVGSCQVASYSFH